MQFSNLFDKKIMKIFFSIFDLSFHLLLIIVIHFCIESDAELRFASVFKVFLSVGSLFLSCLLACNAILCGIAVLRIFCLAYT